MLRTFCALLAAAVLLFPSDAASQLEERGLEDSRERLITLFSELSPHEDVQIATPSLFIEEGRARFLGSDVVEVSAEGQTVPLDLRDIRSVSVRRGHGVKGGLWGLGSGILVGTFAGLLIAGFDCANPVACADTEKRGAVRYGMVFGVVGAATGYLWGRLDQDWVPIFP
jgi:hypothetical protein